jgi:hypothetical protein
MFSRIVEYEIDADTPEAAEAAWEDDGPELGPRVCIVEVLDGTTPNGFDHLWLLALNRVLADRGSNLRVEDLDDHLWGRYLGPLVDALEDGYAVNRHEAPPAPGA